MYERLNLSPLTTIPLTLQLRPCPDGAPSEHNGQIAFPRLSLAGGESPHHNRGKLGGGRTSPELSPSQFATRHTTGGALPSLQLGQCGRFPMGQLPARAGGGDGGWSARGAPRPGRGWGGRPGLKAGKQISSETAPFSWEQPRRVDKRLPQGLFHPHPRTKPAQWIHNPGSSLHNQLLLGVGA